jgi:predicted nucleotidyltransferase
MVDEATIAEAGRRIGAAAPEGSRVILFGSQARGEATSHSDVDILVIEPEVDNATEEAGPPLPDPERSENPGRRPRHRRGQGT